LFEQGHGRRPVGITVLLALAAFSWGCRVRPGVTSPPVETLQSVSAFPVGVAVDAGLLEKNPAYRNVVGEEYGSLTPENAAKIEALHPREGAFDFSGLDRIFAFSKARHKRVHGVALIWHDTGGLGWLKDFRGDTAAWERMSKTHIQTVTRRYRGKIRSWDVVNEAFNDDGTLRSDDEGATDHLGSPWARNLGTDYIARAFRYAHEADPEALPFYNDFELCDARRPKKLEAVLAMVEDFKKRGVPIHGLGVQMHIGVSADEAAIAAALRRMAATGLMTHISELDVLVSDWKKDPALVYTDELQARQARKYERIAEIYGASVPPAQRYGITVWNVGDGDSWIRAAFGLRDWPLPFDAEYHKKRAYFGFLDGLRSAAAGAGKLGSMEIVNSAVPEIAQRPLWGASPIAQPYPYVAAGGLGGASVPESPDPLVAYRWPAPRASDGLEIYLLRPKAVSATPADSFAGVGSLNGADPGVTVTGPGDIRLDFGVEAAAWLEFDSPDCPGGVEMSISEYDEPGFEKTRAPVRHGTTFRLELNPELYEGVRFGWIHVRSCPRPWRMTGIRAVCQVKPANYNGAFSCNDPLLTKVWYMAAYSVRVALCRDYFGAILMDRGDRMSWTGDAHPAQAAALVAFGNADFVRKNIDATSTQDNGIRSYALYWVLSLIDYYMYSGDGATFGRYIPNACAKLDAAYAAFGRDPKLRFYGWDERLCAGFELWFRPCPEAQRAYEFLSIRAWRDFARAAGRYGRSDLQAKYEGFALETMAGLRGGRSRQAEWGLHAAADAVTTGLLTAAEAEALFDREFRDRVNRLSLSPFNQYFILQALARMDRRDDALSTIRDLWGGMLRYGGTTTFEVFRPSWNDVIGPNAAVPNTQCGLTSLCHPWGAGPVKWLNEEVLGIVPTSPGFKTFDVLPRPGRTLSRVSGATPTPFGPIQASFDVSSGRCSLRTPPGTVGRVGIPKAEKAVTRVLVNGRLAWDGRSHAVPGIGGADEDREFILLAPVEAGTYEIEVSYRGTTPAYLEPPVEYAGRFLGSDASTGGDWGGAYGKDGFVLCNYEGRGVDKRSLPSYVTSLEYFRAFPKSGAPDPTMWAPRTSDRRALSADPSNPPQRTAACVSNTDQTMTLTVGLARPRAYQVALYFVDWPGRGARQAVEMFDAESLKLIAPVRIVDDFSGGRYLVYAYDRSAKFRIERIRGDRITLSGVFFDPTPPAGRTGATTGERRFQPDKPATERRPS
jgi:alpha-L-rhamnosidase